MLAMSRKSQFTNF